MIVSQPVSQSVNQSVSQSVQPVSQSVSQTGEQAGLVRKKKIRTISGTTSLRRKFTSCTPLQVGPGH
jgi:hypothetical protein